MEESEKGTSINPKGEKKLLENDIGKEFLSSWKSLSVTEDDPMDFNFDTISGGKEKPFKFKNLDMDFSLDGDFDKLSSFKVDMPDFDLSCSPTKAAKPKERSEEKSSSGNRQGKKDQISFSFDFNELDNFNFGSCLMKEEKISDKNQRSKKEVPSDGIQFQGSQSNLSEGIGTVGDTITMELPASESVPTSRLESLVGYPGNVDSTKDDCVSKTVTSGNLMSSHDDGSSPEKEAITNSAEAMCQQSHTYKNAISTEPYAQEAVLDSPGQSLVAVNKNINIVSDGQTETCSLGTRLHSTTSHRTVNGEMMVIMGSNQENLTIKKSSRPHVTTSGSNTVGKNHSDSKISTETVDDAKSVKCDSDIKDNSANCVSRKATLDSEDSKDNQNSTSKFPSDLLRSDPILNILTPIKGVKPQGFCPNVLKKNETGLLLHESSSFEIKSLSCGIKRIGPTPLSPENEKGEVINANDAQIGSKLRGNPVSVARELVKDKDIFLGGEKNIKNHSNIKEGFNSDGSPSGCKSVGNSQLHDNKATEREPVILGSEQKVKNHSPLSLEDSSFSSSEKSNTSNQRCVNPKLLVSRVESVRNSNILSVEGSKLCPVKAGMMKTDLSTWKISKPLGLNKVSSNSPPQKKVNSQLSSEKNKDVQRTAALETSHTLKNTEKQMQLNLSLKRKALELPNADLVSLKPLKRLSHSHSESRDLVPLKRVVEEKVGIHENHIEDKTKNILCEHPSSMHGSPRKVNVMEFEISSVLENDGNVEKAEAYAKELEDICNMLKKKFEEAKEVLLRAVVNNNNLLMLNHPIHEEKISFYCLHYYFSGVATRAASSFGFDSELFNTHGVPTFPLV
ncbi:hypothetical protein FNV43_RR07475 [Rhamnella rubrinervis]|uniref:Uncharacterized protein n=1 Tax=Rhamnella rubrinervis TaxID=2594499 RepID=A0A8K0HGM1_9ROSA|nr:hypothetical protein FNV43_RR07475 [Rhamnella rubrinervis]